MLSGSLICIAIWPHFAHWTDQPNNERAVNNIVNNELLTILPFCMLWMWLPRTYIKSCVYFVDFTMLDEQRVMDSEDEFEILM